MNGRRKETIPERGMKDRIGRDENGKVRRNGDSMPNR